MRQKTGSTVVDAPGTRLRVKFYGNAPTLLRLIPMTMRRFELVKDRGQVRIDGQFGGTQLRVKGLPVGFGRVRIDLEGLQLLRKAGIIGQGRGVGRFQLGFLSVGQDGMMVMPATRTGRSRG